MTLSKVYFRLQKSATIFTTFTITAILTVCTYICLPGWSASAQVTGQGTITGTVTDSFRTRINGLREMGMNGANITLSRDCPVWERMKLETSIVAYNAFNHQILSAPKHECNE
jgi:hypothetical protein